MAIGAAQDLSDAICISIGEETGNGKNSIWFEVGLMTESHRPWIRGWATNGLMDTHFGMGFCIKPGDGLRHLRWGVVCPVKAVSYPPLTLPTNKEGEYQAAVDDLNKKREEQG